MTPSDATLRTNAGTVEFRFESPTTRRNPENFLLSINAAHPEISLGPPIGVSLFRNDIRGLNEYLRNHIEGLRVRRHAEVPVYTPLELSFLMQALDGEVETPMDGYFSLSFLVCRRFDSNGERAYYGFEGTAILSDIHLFCSELERMADQM